MLTRFEHNVMRRGSTDTRGRWPRRRTRLLIACAWFGAWLGLLVASGPVRVSAQAGLDAAGPSMSPSALHQAPRGAAADLGIFTDHEDVGAVGAPGSAGFVSPTYTVTGSGVGVAGTADEFHFLHRSLTGDGRITARVTGLQDTHPNAIAGVMMRDALSPGSRHVLVTMRPGGGSRTVHRQSSGGATSSSTSNGASVPYWLRLTRTGDQFTVERSSNGSGWSSQGTRTIAMGATIRIGLVVSAVNDGVLNTSTFSNVTVLAPPAAEPDAFPVLEDQQLIAAAPGVLANDTDPDGSPLSVATPRPVAGPTNGTLTLSADGSFRYTPDPDFAGTDSFSYRATDGIWDSPEVTVTITVDAVNDPPRFTRGADQSVAEDAGPQSIAAWATGISAGPGNEMSQAVDFIVSSDDPAFFSAGPAVSAGGVLSFTTTPDANGAATVTVRIHDDGGTAGGGLDTSAPQTFTITVSSINDAPVNGVPGPQTTPRDTALVFSDGAGNGIAVTDVDAGSATVAVQLTVTNGTVTLSGTTGLTFVVGDGTADATLVLLGTLADIDVALDGMWFTPAAGFTGTASVRIRSSDLGNTGSGGSRSDTDTMTITVTVPVPPPVDGFVSSGGWPVAFDPARHLALTFPAYVPPGSSITGATFRHRYGPATAGQTVCYYVQVFNGSMLLASHGSATSPVSCSASPTAVTDTITLPEVDAVAIANALTIRLVVRSSGGGRSAHQLAELELEYGRD